MKTTESLDSVNNGLVLVHHLQKSYAAGYEKNDSVFYSYRYHELVSLENPGTHDCYICTKQCPYSEVAFLRCSGKNVLNIKQK